MLFTLLLLSFFTSISIAGSEYQKSLLTETRLKQLAQMETDEEFLAELKKINTEIFTDGAIRFEPLSAGTAQKIWSDLYYRLNRARSGYQRSINFNETGLNILYVALAITLAGAGGFLGAPYLNKHSSLTQLIARYLLPTIAISFDIFTFWICSILLAYRADNQNDLDFATWLHLTLKFLYQHDTRIN